MRPIWNEIHCLIRFQCCKNKFVNDFKSKGIQITEEITFGEVKDAIASDNLSAGEKHGAKFSVLQHI